MIFYDKTIVTYKELIFNPDNFCREKYYIVLRMAKKSPEAAQSGGSGVISFIFPVSDSTVVKSGVNAGHNRSLIYSYLSHSGTIVL